MNPKRGHISLGIILFGLSIFVFAACSTVKPYSKRQEDALAVMDRAAKYLDQFGSASISSPLLIPALRQNNKELFAYDPKLTTRDLFDMERTETAAQNATAIYTNFALSLGLSGKADTQTISRERAAMESYTRKVDAYKAYDETVLKIATEQLRKDLETASAEGDPAKKAEMVAASRSRFREISGMEQPPVYPVGTESPDIVVNSPAMETKNQPTQSMGNLLNLLKNNQLKTPVRSAILSSAGDKATLGMLNVLMEPATYADAVGKRFLFGVSTVSVRPGWRTTKNYSADITVSTSYDYRPARYEVIKRAYLDALDPNIDKQPYPGHVIALIERWNKKLAEQWKNESKNKMRTAYDFRTSKEHTGKIDETEIPKTLTPGGCSPLVVGISPIVDVQHIDIFEGARRSAEMAAQIAAALNGVGYSAAGNIFAQYSRRLESDKQLRAALPTVTSYSISGIGFGFLISPRMKIDVASGTDPEQKMGLEPQSFPVLVLIQMDNEDIGLHFKKDDGNETWEPVEPHISFSESTRWKRHNNTFFNTEQSELETILLGYKVSELNVGMIGFDTLRKKLKHLKNIESCKQDKDNLVCSPEFTSSLKKLLDDKQAMEVYADKPDERIALFELSMSTADTIQCPSPKEADKNDKLLKEFSSIVKNALKDMQPVPEMSASLIELRSTALKTSLLASGNLQPLPLEFYGITVKAPDPKPVVRTLHACRINATASDDLTYDVYVTGEHLGVKPEVKVLTKTAGEIFGTPNYDKENNLVSFTYRLKKSELSACAAFQIGEAKSELLCFSDIPKEPIFEYERRIQPASGAAPKKPAMSVKPAVAVGKEGGVTPSGKRESGWSETIVGRGNVDLLKSVLEKTDGLE